MMVGRQHIGEQNFEDLALPFGEREVFSIAPAIAGAGGNFGRILLGGWLYRCIVLVPWCWLVRWCGWRGASAVAAATLATVGTG